MTKLNIFLIIVIILLCGALWKTRDKNTVHWSDVLAAYYSLPAQGGIVRIENGVITTIPNPPASTTPQVTGIEVYPTSMPSNAGCGWVEWHSNTPNGCNQ